MPLIMTTAPLVEPITRAEAKTHMRVDTSNDDVLIDALIATSRLQIEAVIGQALIHQTWSLWLDAWPATPSIELPLSPIANLVAVRTFDTNDIAAPVPLASFILDNASVPPRIRRKATFQQSAPLRSTNAIEISFLAGYGSTPVNVPAPIRHALLLLVAHWYDHRDPGETAIPAAKIPDLVSSLLAPFRRPRLT